jgi:hypothetical protein
MSFCDGPMAGEIQYTEQIAISVGMAAYLVDAIDLMEKLLARQAGHPLPSRLSSVRDSFKECITRAATNADASSSVVFEQHSLGFEKDVNAAAKALGITTGGVRWALRNGRLGGRKIGRQWLVSDEDIEFYRQRSA